MLLARPRLHVTWEWPSALAGDAEALLLVKFTVFCGLGTLCYAFEFTSLKVENGVIEVADDEEDIAIDSKDTAVLRFVPATVTGLL